MPADRTTYDTVLREVYTPKLWELQNRDRILFQMIARQTQSYSEGKQINVRLHTGGNGGIGWVDSSAAAPTLPFAGVQKFGSASTNFRRLYGRFQVDGASMTGTRENYAAEVKALEFEARNLVEDIADSLAFDIWQDTVTDGDLAGSLGPTIAAHSTPATGDFSILKSGSGIRVGQIIDITDKDGATGTDGFVSTAGTPIVVTGVTTHATDVTRFDVTTDSATGDGTWDDVVYIVYRQGSRGVEGGAKTAIDGIRGIVLNTGTYLGIDRATNTFWRAQVLGNGGTNREITLPLMQRMMDEIEVNSPGRCNLIVTNHAIWRKIANILVPDKRYGGDMMKLNGWCEAVDFRGIPVVRDKYAPANRAYFLDTTTFKLWQDSEGGFIDEDGQILHWVTGKDAFEAAWRRFVQLVCCDPASNGVLQDIKE